MFNDDDKNKMIPRLELPESIRNIMIPITNRMADETKAKGIAQDTLKINFEISSKNLEKNEFIAYIITEWITETSVIIDNLNLILDDLKFISISKDNFKGDIRTRLYLLLRTFFYEFYRIKEQFNMSVQTLRKNEVIEKDTAKLMKKCIEYIFKEMLITRHLLTHHKSYFNQKDHVDLALVDLNNKLGLKVIDIKNENIVTLQDLLTKISNKYIDILSKEAIRMRDALQKLIDFFEGGIDALAARLAD